MKTFIRVLLCLGSACIIIANWPTMGVGFIGGSFFFLANFVSLLWNLRGKRTEPPTTKRMRSLMR